MDEKEVSDKSAGPQMNMSSGKAFEVSVADIYRSLGCRVQTNVRLAGQEIDILVRRHVEGVGPMAFLVECKDWAKPVGNQVVQNITASVNALRAAGVIQFGVVVSKSGFTPDAKASVEPIPYVSLLAFDELENEIFDAGVGPRQLTRVYQAQEIFSEFVDIDGNRSSWQHPFTEGIDDIVPNLCDVIHRSIVNGETKKYFVLGDFGAGKSTLLRRLQYQLCESKLESDSSYLPIFVPLKDYYKTQNLSTLLRNSFTNDFLGDVSAELLWVSVRQGRFVFLLDGFDEMTDRSGEERRNYLFEALLPILLSPCPAVLTSRPSLFVAKGEIDGLISRWHDDSELLRVTPVPPNEKAVKRYDDIEQLKARLLMRLRAPTHGYTDPELLSDNRLAVVNIQPFDAGKIRQYLGRRFKAPSGSAKVFRYSVEDTLAFIERTYDLSDLASRPLLLTMIVDTIIEGGINVTDPSVQFGPSALYELYISLKLELDWDKGDVRRGALDRKQRRDFAEAVALTMPKAGRLDVALGDVLAVLPDRIVSAGGGTLSAEELATDFLTCSFLTIDERQICRFVHKSFLEFFVAYRIKNKLTAGNSLLQDELPTAVLYFLGGFAPTERNVQQRLWSLFGRTPETQKTLRRNLLAAYLFVSPDHTSRKISNVELDNVAYGRLDLTKVTLRQTLLKAVTIGNLSLRQSSWADVQFIQCNISTWAISASSIACSIKSSELGSISASDAQAMKLILGDCEVLSLDVKTSAGSFEIRDTSIVRLSIEQSHFSLRMIRSQITHLHISGSDITIRSGDEFEDFSLDKGLIEGCTLRIDSVHRIPEAIRFKNCFIEVIHETSDTLIKRSAIEFQNADSGSCVFDPKAAISPKQIKVAKCGLLGFEWAESIGRLKDFGGWGILIAVGPALADMPKDAGYLKVSGGVAVCTRSWFMKEVIDNVHVMHWVNNRVCGIEHADHGEAARQVIADLRQMVFDLRNE